MAARKNPLNRPQSYSLQRAKQLLNRLNKFAFGKVEMTNAQVKAAQIVIGKEIPDVAKIEHTGQGGGPMLAKVTVEFVSKAA